jgi:hypothetical protein
MKNIETPKVDQEGNVHYKGEIIENVYCPKCGWAYIAHNDDGSCVED